MTKIKLDTAPVLRKRDELEKLLAAQIAIGAITSLDEAEERGNLDALEYCSQMLFDNVRQRIAERDKLPLHIVMHLVKDRKDTIRFKVIQNNYENLPDETKEAFFNEAEMIHKQLKNRDRYRSHETREGACQNAMRIIITKVYNAGLDKLMVRLLDIIQHEAHEYRMPDGIGDAAYLRDMPLTCARVFVPPENTIKTICLVHPDVEVRMPAVMQVLAMKVKDLRNHFPQEEDRAHKNTTHIRDEVYGIIAKDPDIKIRRALIEGINHEPTLSWMAFSEKDAEGCTINANEPDSLLRRKARMKANRAKKRSVYHAEYHANKN